MHLNQVNWCTCIWHFLWFSSAAGRLPERPTCHPLKIPISDWLVLLAVEFKEFVSNNLILEFSKCSIHSFESDTWPPCRLRCECGIDLSSSPTVPFCTTRGACCQFACVSSPSLLVFAFARSLSRFPRNVAVRVAHTRLADCIRSGRYFIGTIVVFFFASSVFNFAVVIYSCAVFPSSESFFLVLRVHFLPSSGVWCLPAKWARKELLVCILVVADVVFVDAAFVTSLAWIRSGPRDWIFSILFNPLLLLAGFDPVFCQLIASWCRLWILLLLHNDGYFAEFQLPSWNGVFDASTAVCVTVANRVSNCELCSARVWTFLISIFYVNNLFDDWWLGFCFLFLRWRPKKMSILFRCRANPRRVLLKRCSRNCG